MAHVPVCEFLAVALCTPSTKACLCAERAKTLLSCLCCKLIWSLIPGAEPVADPLRVLPVTSPGVLLHSLLAVSHAPAPEFLLSVNVAGFLYVSDVDVTRNTARPASRASAKQRARDIAEAVPCHSMEAS